jgi:hypothetical protein
VSPQWDRCGAIVRRRSMMLDGSKSRMTTSSSWRTNKAWRQCCIHWDTRMRSRACEGRMKGSLLASGGRAAHNGELVDSRRMHNSPSHEHPRGASCLHQLLRPLIKSRRDRSLCEPPFLPFVRPRGVPLRRTNRSPTHLARRQPPKPELYFPP